MSTIHLDTKYAPEIVQAFTADSYVKNRLTGNTDFVGAQTVRLHNINTVPLNDYNRSASANRYGAPTEVGDTVQELQMTQDKSFSGVIDKGNSLDQSINKSAEFLGVQLREAVVPAYDRYCLNALAHRAGKIAGNAAAIGKDNVIARAAAARSWFLDHRVPTSGRTMFVTTDVFNALVDTDQFKNLQAVGEKALAKGQVGELFGAAVVEVPSDLMPANVNFILAHKRAATAPEKLHDCKTHVDPQGYSGNVCEGRFYYDLFVYGPKADGVYADVTTGSGKGTVCALPTVSTAGAVTAASGCTAYYTTDGSDPRYSVTAAAGTPSGTLAAGTVVRAYQDKEGAFCSGVAEAAVA